MRAAPLPRVLLDTNVILRYVLRDHAELSPRAVALFQEAEAKRCVLVVNDVALAEAVWVLTSFYKRERAAVAEVLAGVLRLPGVRAPQAGALLDALGRFGGGNADFFDGYLAATAAARGWRVASFDEDVLRFPDVQAWEPGEPGG